MPVMSYEFNWLAVADIITLLSATFFASYVLKANPKNKCNRVFALMFFLIGIAGLSGAMWFFSTDLNTMGLWENICFFSFSPLYALIVYFTSIFPRKCTIFSKNKYATILLFVPCFIGWILYLWDRRMHGMHGKEEEFMLEGLRKKLGISKKYHDKLVADVKKEIKLHPQLTPIS